MLSWRITDVARNGIVPLNVPRSSPRRTVKSDSTVTDNRRVGSIESGGVTVIPFTVKPAALHTSLTLMVTAFTSGAVTAAKRAPSRAADVKTLTVIHALANSTMPNKMMRSSGRTRANSITACPRFLRMKETNFRFLSTSTPPES